MNVKLRVWRQKNSESHGTFEQYCQERWGMRKAHAYRLIGAAEVLASTISPTRKWVISC